jgi:uncharacterized cupin superfamily protein
MHSPILNIADVDMIDLAERARQRGSEMPSARYGGRIGPIGQTIGAQKLGYNLTAIAPGKAAFPKHSHRVNEEMFFVIEGTGELKLGGATYPIRAGDVIACPPGDARTAHQLINTGNDELRFLAVSTMIFPEICEYPDSGKLNAITGMGPDDFRHLARHGESLDYWDGEA